MKECDIFRGQNILWPLLHIFRGSVPPQPRRIYALTALQWVFDGRRRRGRLRTTCRRTVTLGWRSWEQAHDWTRWKHCMDAMCWQARRKKVKVKLQQRLHQNAINECSHFKPTQTYNECIQQYGNQTCHKPMACWIHFVNGCNRRLNQAVSALCHTDQSEAIWHVGQETTKAAAAAAADADGTEYSWTDTRVGKLAGSTQDIHKDSTKNTSAS